VCERDLRHGEGVCRWCGLKGGCLGNCWEIRFSQGHVQYSRDRCQALTEYKQRAEVNGLCNISVCWQHSDMSERGEKLEFVGDHKDNHSRVCKGNKFIQSSLYYSLKLTLDAIN